MCIYLNLMILIKIIRGFIRALHRQVVSGLNEAQLMRDFVADGGSLIGLVKKHCEIWAGD